MSFHLIELPSNLTLFIFLVKTVQFPMKPERLKILFVNPFLIQFYPYDTDVFEERIILNT